jgi:hypothetical protein
MTTEKVTTASPTKAEIDENAEDLPKNNMDLLKTLPISKDDQGRYTVEVVFLN